MRQILERRIAVNSWIAERSNVLRDSQHEELMGFMGYIAVAATLLILWMVTS